MQYVLHTVYGVHFADFIHSKATLSTFWNRIRVVPNWFCVHLLVFIIFLSNLQFYPSQILESNSSIHLLIGYEISISQWYRYFLIEQ